jgi:hypothetical protein
MAKERISRAAKQALKDMAAEQHRIRNTDPTKEIMNVWELFCPQVRRMNKAIMSNNKPKNTKT